MAAAPMKSPAAAKSAAPSAKSVSAASACSRNSSRQERAQQNDQDSKKSAQPDLPRADVNGSRSDRTVESNRKCVIAALIRMARCAPASELQQLAPLGSGSSAVSATCARTNVALNC